MRVTTLQAAAQVIVDYVQAEIGTFHRFEATDIDQPAWGDGDRDYQGRSGGHQLAGAPPALVVPASPANAAPVDIKVALRFIYGAKTDEDEVSSTGGCFSCCSDQEVTRRFSQKVHGARVVSLGASLAHKNWVEAILPEVKTLSGEKVQKDYRYVYVP